MKMIPRAGKFTPDDAQTLATLADNANMTVSEFINLAVGRIALEAGHQWQGKRRSWGDASRFSADLEHADVALLGLPPLAEDD